MSQTDVMAGSTVSELASDSTPLPIRRVVVQQARMFSSVCDVYAPMYRQVTLNGDQTALNESVEIAYRIGAHHYLVVVNAGNRDAAYAWMKEREIRGSEIRDASDEYALLAVQGPRALERLELPRAKPFTHAMGGLDGVEVMVNRTGYTGEEGVELMCPAEDAEALWDAIIARGVVPAGLGARDTLRLEVCYPLHGNDISEDTDAISAGLVWTCALAKEFSGVAELRRIKEEGPEQKLVAFVMEEKAIPRQGMEIAGGGRVTSGTHSPMLDKGIGLGYVPTALATPGTELEIDVRGKSRRATVVPKPIYKPEED